MPEQDPAYAETLARYERVIAAVPGLERKGANNPYTAINGNMSSYLHPRGEVALRLPPAARERFLAEQGTTLFEAYGVIQKEYVTVPATMLSDTETLAPWPRASFDYVSGLKPKPTKKSKT
ncbi:MAG TPA: hypothetical protein VGG68_05345 [Caulobacteraceae bacterium]|jgi:hypothetical protein